MVKRDLIRNIIILLVIVLAIILLRIFLFSTVEIKADSANSFLAKGDFVTVATKREPVDNDFVVYKVDNKEYVGRVVAQPGQKVTSVDDVLYINNKVKHEPYLKKEYNHFMKKSQPGQYFTEDFTTEIIGKSDKVTKVPKDSYLVLNDNRQDKNDSRKFGFISKKQVKGVISFRLWPLNKFGFVRIE